MVAGWYIGLHTYHIGFEHAVKCRQKAFPVQQVVLDLGRKPEARFAGAVGGEYLRDEEVSRICSGKLTDRVHIAFETAPHSPTQPYCTDQRKPARKHGDVDHAL